MKLTCSCNPKPFDPREGTCPHCGTGVHEIYYYSIMARLESMRKKKGLAEGLGLRSWAAENVPSIYDEMRKKEAVYDGLFQDLAIKFDKDLFKRFSDAGREFGKAYSELFTAYQEAEKCEEIAA